MEDLTKRQKRHLKRLAEIGYERELERCLNVLYKKFKLWKKGEISVLDLHDKIHEFYKDIARSLYEQYTINDPLLPVVFGVKSGVLKLDEVREDCKQHVECLLHWDEDTNTH